MLYALICHDDHVMTTLATPKYLIVGKTKYKVERTDGRLLYTTNGVYELSVDILYADKNSVKGAKIIFYTAEEIIASLPADTRGDILTKITSFKEICPEDIPPTREYRNSWEMSGKKIKHNMAKAKNIHRDKLRVERGPLLAALDVEFMRTFEVAGDIDVVMKKKQVLRDITKHPAIDKAKTIDDLKCITCESHANGE